MSELSIFTRIHWKSEFYKVGKFSLRYQVFEGVAMILEHLVYSIAIAIIFGMVSRRITGRESSWIIVLSAYAPDIDIIADAILRKIGITVLVYGAPIAKDFHNLGVLLVYAVAVSFLLHPLGICFVDSFIFATSSV